VIHYITPGRGIPSGGVLIAHLGPISSLFAPCHTGAALRDLRRESRGRDTRKHSQGRSLQRPCTTLHVVAARLQNAGPPRNTASATNEHGSNSHSHHRNRGSRESTLDPANATPVARRAGTSGATHMRHCLRPGNRRIFGPIYLDCENCHKVVVEMRWPDGLVRCPSCGFDNVTYLANVRRWKCCAKHPKPQFVQGRNRV
jgi:hypothetical protein